MDWLSDEEPMVHAFQGSPWKVIIVDDEPEVHKVTKLTLKEFGFENRPLQFIHAYSAKEAMTLFQQHQDIALVILDVVMEQEDSGLQLVKYIRETLSNHFTRIILRTGQPGHLPEEQVIRDYDIDSYQYKTELTRQKLHLLFYTHLRAYRDIVSIQRYQKGLKAVTETMVNLAEIDKVSDFAGALMQQLAIVLNSSQTEFIMQDSEAFALTDNKRQRWHIMVNEQGAELLSHGERSDNNKDFVAFAERALEQQESLLEPPLYAHYYQSKTGLESVFILRNSQLLSDFNQSLLQLFSQNTVIMLEHLFDRQPPESQP